MRDKLHACWLFNQEHGQFCNDRKGVKALSVWARAIGITRVVFESTGVYHGCLETGLAGQGISFARGHPRHARRFCEGVGQLAKTDRVEAAILANMGSLLELKVNPVDPPESKAFHDIRQLATARLALIKDRTGARARLAATTHKRLALQIKRRLKQIKRDLCQISEMIDAIVAADEDLAAHAGILRSIPGIAKGKACAK